MDADVIVIGAGLAGLQSARRLEAGGRTVMVVEAEDAVGGRVRTDVIDGFRCDRGFQLLNPAYPAVQRCIDVDALGLQRFGVGAIVRTGGRTVTLAHPLRHPRHLLATRDERAHPRVRPPRARPLARADAAARPHRVARAHATRRSVRRSTTAALTGRLRRDVLDTFLAGVLADSTGASSANYVRLLLRSFALGVPGLPREGMQALPEQLAAALAAPVRLRTAARDLRETADGVQVMTDAGAIRARAAVVAVGPQDVAGLSPLAAPDTHGLTTWWFRATGQPRTGPFLLLDASRPGGGPAGPIWNTAVISEVAPSYAPRGQHLVQATTLLDRPDGRASEADVRRDLARLFRTSTRRLGGARAPCRAARRAGAATGSDRSRTRVDGGARARHGRPSRDGIDPGRAGRRRSRGSSRGAPPQRAQLMQVVASGRASSRSGAIGPPHTAQMPSSPAESRAAAASIAASAATSVCRSPSSLDHSDDSETPSGSCSSSSCCRSRMLRSSASSRSTSASAATSSARRSAMPSARLPVTAHT